MLTDLIALLNVTWSHRIQRWLGIDVHEWLEGMCPCSVDTDPGEGDLAADWLVAA